MLVSERIGQFFVEGDTGRDRLEYTEYGSGDAWVVLLHGQLMPRRMHQPLARALAAEGLHVVTLDLLGHGRSDRPADPLVYSMTAFGEQVVALLDHLGAPQAVIGGTSLGANVSLEVAVIAPERVRGLIIEMPVLNNALEAGILAFGPLLFAARFLPFTVNGLRMLTRPIPRGLVPFWVGIGLDTLDQRAGVGRRGGARHVLRPGRPVVEAAARDHRAGARRRAPRRPDPPRGRRRHAGRGDAAGDLRARPQHPGVAEDSPTGSTAPRSASRWGCWQTPRRSGRVSNRRP